MADALPVLIAYVDRDGRYQFNNAAYERWFGIRPEAIKGRHVREVLGNGAYETVRPHIEAVLGGRPQTFAGRLSYPIGGVRDVHLVYVPHRDDRSDVIGFYALIIDVSDLRRAEKLLRTSEVLNRAVLSSLSARIAIINRVGVILAVNEAWDRFADHNETSLVAAVRPGTDYLAICRATASSQSKWVRQALAGIEDVLTGRSERFGLEYPCPGQVDRQWFEMVVEPLRHPGGGAVISHTDITPRKLAQEALHRSEARLGAIVRSAADAIITIDPNGIIESVNPAAERMFGYSASKMVGQGVAILMPSPYREEHEGYLERFRRTGVGKIIGRGVEVRGVRRDGSVFPVELTVSAVNHQGLFTGILRDITDRKQLEREVLEAGAVEQWRIGQELHDTVGQELTGLGLLAAALAKRTTDPVNAVAVERIVEELGRVHQRVRSLSRGLVPVEVDPEGLRAALEELASRTNEGTGTECEFEEEGAVTFEDAGTATHLLRITQEAVSNALRHGRPGHIWITLRRRPSCHVLEVRDDGIGIPEAPAGEGGLGIRLMRYRAGIIGGTLTLGRVEGGGTRVTCLLPRRDQHATE
jgi:PAS domain S-box-containing protein